MASPTFRCMAARKWRTLLRWSLNWLENDVDVCYEPEKRSVSMAAEESKEREMTEQVETVIIGGGQAGLALSYYLTRQGRTHLVLEQGRVGETWRSGRWDSFTLNTPNWMTQLPGFAYQDDDPDGFLPREDIVGYLEQYAASFHAPLQCGVRVTVVRQQAGGDGYLVEAEEMTVKARNVVLATGPYQKPKLPTASAACPWTSARCTRVSTAIRRCCLPAPSWWWVQASQAARSQRICTRAGGRFTCPPRAVGELRGATAARTPPGGSPVSGFSIEPLISFPHPLPDSRVTPMFQVTMGETSTCAHLPGKG